ncbi:MAG TPA: cystathionine gamma-synthase family protein [Bdellovibrionota bacterium]|jgi:methionine-gamma-lyase|nr:cystathionine gamma-synthase family protein [Bdellovibrionota bacterium]
MMNRKNRGGRDLHPETLALGYGYDPKLSEGAVKAPMFLTSTFQFERAEDGKRFFELAYGLREKDPGEVPGLIYSRINNPNVQIFEERMAAWDKVDRSAAFASGMAAITTFFLSTCKPGDVVLYAGPIYGGTFFFFEKILPQFQIRCIEIDGGGLCPATLEAHIHEHGLERVKVVYLETPANPSNVLVDMRAIADVIDRVATEAHRPLFAVDNTFLGPVFQCPKDHGVDVVLYSATKFIGGHSDLIAGVVSGPAAVMEAVVGYRSILGTLPSAFDAWLLLRSLETLSVRMKRQARTAQAIAGFLKIHPMVKSVAFPGMEPDGSPEREIYDRQCSGTGSLISFEIHGGEAEAFAVLNRFEVMRLAVSLGGTESLVQHPASMTHSDVPVEIKNRSGITPALIRMSVGLEHEEDLIDDLKQALDVLPAPRVTLTSGAQADFDAP